jgi:hypothetical protein
VAVTAKLYGKFFLACMNKEVDLPDDTIKTMLTTSTYTPDQDVHDYKDDVTNEVTGTGYSAGGATLANDVLTYTAGTNVIMYDADDATWASSTITARTAVVYDDSPATAGTKPLICYQQSDADISSTGGEFRVAWNASGIFTITVG